MASPPPGGGGPSPQQLAQFQAALQAEAAKRGQTVEQFQAEQKARIEAEAKAQGLTPEQYIQKLRADAIAQHQRMLQQQQQQGGQAPAQQQGQPQQGQPAQQQGQPAQQPQQVPIQPQGPPNPQAVALARWLKTQELKQRTCILNGQRKDMFKVKRALRAIESPAYDKAAGKKKSQLPQRTEQFPAAEIFKLLPLSLLALRVTQVDPHEGHGHGPSKKRTKGLWTVKIEQQQDINPDLHYAWLYDGPQTKQKVYAGLALLGVLALVCFPLWPVTLRLGVWYLSMGMLGLIGLFFAMAIFRLILFCITVFAVPPGLWLYPNLFEDVGFFDSFRPGWGWNEDPKAAKKAKRDARKAKTAAKEAKTKVATAIGATPPTATTTSAAVGGEGTMTQRSLAPQVEEAEDSD